MDAPAMQIVILPRATPVCNGTRVDPFAMHFGKRSKLSHLAP